MGKKRDRRLSAEEKRRHELQEFFQHLIVFTVVNGVLLVINLITSPGSLWFFWVTLFWGIGLAIQGFNALALDRRLTDRVMGTREDEPPAPRPPASAPASPSNDTSNGAELPQIMDRASSLIDRMRASARQIPGTDPRREALDACAASDRVLSAIADHPDELPLARDFVDRFLEPASTVIGDYARLANRNVPSARETLEAVETQDLPLITRKADELYDRLHRGTLIDLQVAREMLTLDMADVSLPTSDVQRPT
jgi:hypothetical protein